jgi:hypothetical protein
MRGPCCRADLIHASLREGLRGEFLVDGDRHMERSTNYIYPIDDRFWYIALDGRKNPCHSLL